MPSEAPAGEDLSNPGEDLRRAGLLALLHPQHDASQGGLAYGSEGGFSAQRRDEKAEP